MMSLTRETDCGEKVSMIRNVRENLCLIWFCTLRKGMGSHLRVDWLKAERVRRSLLVTMAVCWKEGSFWKGFRTAEVGDTNPFRAPQLGVKARLQLVRYTRFIKFLGSVC